MGLRDTVINLFALLGAAIVAYGLWLAYQPAGIVAAGAGLMAVAVALARTAHEPNRRTH